MAGDVAVLLIDSTKYVSWMRAGLNPVSVLAEQLRTRSLVSCGIVRIEVLRGMVKPAAKRQISELFDVIPEIPLDGAIIHDAVETAWQLDRSGRVLPLSDLLIAACAKRAGATVISEDSHFQLVPDLSIRVELTVL